MGGGDINSKYLECSKELSNSLTLTRYQSFNKGSDSSNFHISDST